MEERTAKGCPDAQEDDPRVQTGRVTAEPRKKQVTVRGERSWDEVVLTVRAGEVWGHRIEISWSQAGTFLLHAGDGKERGGWHPAGQQKVHLPFGETRP